jgi:hypothetical protein
MRHEIYLMYGIVHFFTSLEKTIAAIASLRVGFTTFGLVGTPQPPSRVGRRAPFTSHAEAVWRSQRRTVQNDSKSFDRQGHSDQS